MTYQRCADCGHGRNLHRWDDPPSKPPRKRRPCTVGTGPLLEKCGCLDWRAS